MTADAGSEARTSGPGVARVAGPSPGESDGSIRSYHGQPVLKDPVWTWEIPNYFFAGGMAGASAGLAFCSGVRGNELLARRAWMVAFAGIGVSPVLLISDLGRPERFLNMMRMFKVTSPMSVGSWVLAGAGGAITFAAADAWTGWFPRIGRVARPSAALLGLPLSTYTAALVANTAVPAWHEARLMLPFVFGSGAALSAGGASVALVPKAAAAPARRLALGAAVAELASSELMSRQLGDHGEPYRQGPASRFRRLSQACIAGGAALLAWRGRSSRAASVASGALLCAGALSTRWSVYKAGFQSASDPKYVIGPQRAAIERGERRGAARRTAR
jgi:hypothetical protein